MPISYGSFEKQVKLLPINLAADGTASVSVRYGYVDKGELIGAQVETFSMTAEEVDVVLAARPVPGLCRRDDLAFAIYLHLVEQGKVPMGAVS